jgi:hypothetical protein
MLNCGNCWHRPGCCLWWQNGIDYISATRDYVLWLVVWRITLSCCSLDKVLVTKLLSTDKLKYSVEIGKYRPSYETALGLMRFCVRRAPFKPCMELLCVNCFRFVTCDLIEGKRRQYKDSHSTTNCTPTLRIRCSEVWSLYDGWFHG